MFIKVPFLWFIEIFLRPDHFEADFNSLTSAKEWTRRITTLNIILLK